MLLPVKHAENCHLVLFRSNAKDKTVTSGNLVEMPCQLRPDFRDRVFDLDQQLRHKIIPGNW